MSDVKQSDREIIEKLRAERDMLRKRLEQVEKETLFSEAIENISEAIVIYDADGRLIACNQNFCDLYGYAPEEARPGVHYAELGRIDIERGNVAVGDEYGGGEEYLKRKAEYRKKLKGSFTVQLKDGRWIKTIDRPMRRGGFVSIQIDITATKKTERDLRTAKDQAERAARFKTEFLANMSHDLRTPLNAVVGFSEMMRDEVLGPIGNERYQEYIENIHNSGSLLISLVNDILDISKLESGQVSVRSEHFDPVRESRSLLRNFAPIAERKDLAIKLSSSEGFPDRIFAEKRAIQQILNNLVSNACKHTDDGGHIDGHWENRNETAIALSVRDNGSGIPSDVMEKIGQPFSPANAYVSDGAERSTGLGLYICRKLVTAMGGRMDIHSDYGMGTTVTLIWPKACVMPGI